MDEIVNGNDGSACICGAIVAVVIRCYNTVPNLYVVADLLTFG